MNKAEVREWKRLWRGVCVLALYAAHNHVSYMEVYKETLTKGDLEAVHRYVEEHGEQSQRDVGKVKNGLYDVEEW